MVVDGYNLKILAVFIFELIVAWIIYADPSSINIIMPAVFIIELYFMMAFSMHFIKLKAEAGVVSFKDRLLVIPYMFGVVLFIMILSKIVAVNFAVYVMVLGAVLSLSSKLMFKLFDRGKGEKGGHKQIP